MYAGDIANSVDQNTMMCHAECISITDDTAMPPQSIEKTTTTNGTNNVLLHSITKL